MAKYRILYWYDIPSQIRVEDESGRISKQLPERFQEAIDDAAMRSKSINEDSYTDGFQWSDEKDRPGTAEVVSSQILEELDHQYQEIDWKKTADRIKAQKKS